MTARGDAEFPAVGKIRIELFASPRGDVREGDILTLTLLLRNASLRCVHDLVLAVPPPRGTRAVEGWLYRDAQRVEGGAFFSDGLDLGELQPGSKIAFMWKVRVGDGDGAVRVVPQLWGATMPVIGSEAIRISRKVSPLLV